MCQKRVISWAVLMDCSIYPSRLLYVKNVRLLWVSLTWTLLFFISSCLSNQCIPKYPSTINCRLLTQLWVNSVYVNSVSMVCSCMITYNLWFTDRLGNDNVEKLALVSDLEEIITFYSKSNSIPFRKDNGWTDLLQLLSVLKLPKPQLYNCFHALVNRYIPK